MNFLGGFINFIGYLPLYIIGIPSIVSVIIVMLDMSAEHRQKYQYSNDCLH